MEDKEEELAEKRRTTRPYFLLLPNSRRSHLFLLEDCGRGSFCHHYYYYSGVWRMVALLSLEKKQLFRVCIGMKRKVEMVIGRGTLLQIGESENYSQIEETPSCTFL